MMTAHGARSWEETWWALRGPSRPSDVLTWSQCPGRSPASPRVLQPLRGARRQERTHGQAPSYARFAKSADWGRILAPSGPARRAPSCPSDGGAVLYPAYAGTRAPSHPSASLRVRPRLGRGDVPLPQMCWRSADRPTRAEGRS